MCFALLLSGFNVFFPTKHRLFRFSFKDPALTAAEAILFFACELASLHSALQEEPADSADRSVASKGC